MAELIKLKVCGGKKNQNNKQTKAKGLKE